MRPAPALRDYELATQLGKLPGYALIGTREMAAMTGFALNSIRQRKVPLPPPAYASRRKLLWRLQDVREWLAKLGVAGRPRFSKILRSQSEMSRKIESPIVGRGEK